MDSLTSLDQIRKRSPMYIGDTTVHGLHHLFDELLDNSIDQFLANQATSITVATSGSTLEFTDDGPGLPFDEPGPHSESLATYYLTQIRRDSPTADGHTPHTHRNGWGVGLRVVTALTETCEVTSWRNNNGWRQTFSKGVPDGPPRIVSQSGDRGTMFRLRIDRELFSADWCQERIDQRLMEAAYLFPGLQVQSPNFQFSAPRGLADLASKMVSGMGCADADRIWWFHDSSDDLHIQAAIAGTDSETYWRAYANGSTKTEKGVHLTALKRVVAACKIKPAMAFIHVILANPRFAGPTRSILEVPEIFSPLYQTLKPSLKAFAAEA